MNSDKQYFDRLEEEYSEKYGHELYKECKGTTGVKPTHQICKKAQQDVGIFLLKLD